MKVESAGSKKTEKIPTERRLQLYAGMLKPRLIEEKMLLLLRQGKVSKWFSGIGQEAISVGVLAALDADELVFPLHRNLGVFTMRGMPLERLFSQFQGRARGYTKGRDRSFHFGAMEHSIVGMISHLGPQLSLADGVGLAHTLRGEKKVAVAFTGEGGTSQGEFHEALNVAAVWDLPVIFIIENNGYGLSTPPTEQYRCKQLSDRGAGYGIEAVTIDGNDVEEVYRTVDRYAQEIRKKPRPILIECLTFRMRGHEEASGTKYVPPELFEQWKKKDPLLMLEKSLTADGILNSGLIESIRREILSEVEEAIERAFNEQPITASVEGELADIYAPVPPRSSVAIESRPRTVRRYIDAISDGLREGMVEWDNLVLMGQDIAEYGGVFKITEGFVTKFGKDRVRNTPLCESAIVGAALGLSLKGFKSVVEMQFADFVSCAFNQIINNLAKLHYRWGQNADVVIRMPTGAGAGAGPFHSQSNEAWFFHTPGLKVVYPAFPSDAKGLLLAAIHDPNPVIFFEHKSLYRSIDQEVPEGFYLEEIGKGRVVLEGDDACVLTYGMGVHWALDVVKHTGSSVRVVDLRTLLPLDYDLIRESVEKTGRVLVLHEDTLVGGIGGEIASWIGEHLFRSLDAPVMRCASLDTPVPFARELEDQFLGKNRVKETLERLLSY